MNLQSPQDVRITRVTGFDLEVRRNKLAGRNSRLDVHGEKARDQMLRLYSDAGLEGVGHCRASEAEAVKLLGVDPFRQCGQPFSRFPELLGHGTMPLWDLAGKLLDRPVYELLGGRGARTVPVYDGSIYFVDLLPQYAAGWRDRIRQEVDMGRALGHEAFKIKIGRGSKWMEREAGDARDEEVVRLVREHAGEQVLLGVDANNGYDPAGARRFLDRVADVGIAFAEEMFEETVDECLQFKEFIAQRGWSILLADGETQTSLDAFKPFLAARAIDVYQADMVDFGIEGVMTEAEWAHEQGLQVAPHNWGSLVGFYLQLHVALAIPNFYRAEHDPLSSDVLLAEGYSLRGGRATVPDRPGFGLTIDEERFGREARIRFDVRL